MNRHWMAAVICTGIAACAASGPDSPEPVADSESVSEKAAETVVPKAASGEDVVASTSAEAVTPSEPGITDMPARTQRICKRERKTGSHRAREVCRTREQIEKEELEGKEAFEDLHRSQVEYD